MLVKTIEDKKYGIKWEIFKISDNSYFYNYYEYFSQIGWRLTGTSEHMSKNCIEWVLDTSVI